MKLWRVRNDVTVRQFILELLTIKLLKGKKSLSLTSQLKYIWQEFRDHPDSLCVEDPANPEGNDLSDLVKAARNSLSFIADSTLVKLEDKGWEAVFGKLDDSSDKDKGAALHIMVASVRTPTKPYRE